MTEKRSRSSSREPPQKQRENSSQGSKREKKSSQSSERSRSGRSREPSKNHAKVSAVVDVDDVLASDQETEVMALLEIGQKDEGRNSNIHRLLITNDLCTVYWENVNKLLINTN